ncbi:MAG: DNA methylase N-4 [Alphaproteobacteria bacterium]|nr:MAG: DNA methylase N-4 [Alphaproteobacteria bacterium]
MSLPNLPVINFVAAKTYMLSTSALTAHSKATRRHPPEQVEKIAANIREYGFVFPIVVGSDNQVLAGHARLEAARQLGLEEVPVVSQAHLSDADQRAFMLADNKLTEDSNWDLKALRAELTSLASLDIKLSLFDLGFKTADIDKAFSLNVDDAGPEDFQQGEDQAEVSRLGDVWIMDDHRLVCGDATKDETYDLLMLEGDQARMIFTDPPFNQKIVGFVSKRDSDRREFPMASGEMSDEEFTSFLTESLGFASNHLMSGGIAYVCMDWRGIVNVMDAADEVFDELKNVCVWAKPNAGMGAFYRSQHELVFVYKKGKDPHVNNFGLGEVRYRTNVWTYPGGSGFHKDRTADLALHPTAKPVAMIADAIMDVSHRGEIVLDPFAGSGATLMAAIKTGRFARLIELDPQYVDVIVRRFQQGGGEAWLEATGQSFDEVAAERAGHPDGADDEATIGNAPE